MNPRPAARWRRLAPWGAVVAVAHGLLLQQGPREPGPRMGPAAPAPRFSTRSVQPLAAAAPATLPTPAPTRPRTSTRGPTPVAATVERAELTTAAASAAPDRAPAVSTPTGPVSAASAPSAAAQPAAPPAAPHPHAIPPPAVLRYEVVAQVRGFAAAGEAELAWRHDGAAYEAQLTLRAPLLPARVQRSVGRLGPQGLAPDHFSDRSRGEQATHFDREQQRLVFSANRPSVPLEAGMQDRLSVLLQLAAQLAGDPAAYPPGTELVLPTASTRDAQAWHFEVVGDETLDLPAGRTATLKLQRLPRREYDQRIELWLAPGAAYAPVRLRLTNPNGDEIDQRWSSTDR